MHYRSLSGHSYLTFAALVQLSIAKLKQFWIIQAKWILTCRCMLKYWNAEFSLQKHIKWFSSKLCWWNVKTQQLPVILDLCFKKTHTWKSYYYWDVMFFKKLLFKIFLSMLKFKVGIFKFLEFEEQFWKALFSWALAWMVDLTSNFSSIMVMRS